MAEKRGHNKLQAMPSPNMSDFADDGRGIPFTRLYEVPSAPSRGGEDRAPSPPVSRLAQAVPASRAPQAFAASAQVQRPRPNGEILSGFAAAVDFCTSPARGGEREGLKEVGRCGSEASVDARLGSCIADVDSLRKKLEFLSAKLEDSDSVHRGQVSSVSERIFEAEKTLRQAAERQDDAIEKASATFQKQSSNLMHVINQVNSNFEHLSQQIAQQGVSLGTFEQSMAQLQATVSQIQSESRMSSESFGHDLAALENTVQQQHEALEHDVALHSQDIGEVQMGLQAVRDTVVRMTPHTQFVEVEARHHSLQEQVEALRELVYGVQAQQQTFLEQVSNTQEQVARFAASAFSPVASSPTSMLSRLEALGRGSSITPVASIVSTGALLRDAASDDALRRHRLVVSDPRLAASASMLEPGHNTPSHSSTAQCVGGVTRASWLGGFESIAAAEQDAHDVMHRAPAAPSLSTKLAPRRHTADLGAPHSRLSGLAQGESASVDAGYEELFQDYIPNTPWESSGLHEDSPSSIIHASVGAELLSRSRPPLVAEGRGDPHAVLGGGFGVPMAARWS